MRPVVTSLFSPIVSRITFTSTFRTGFDDNDWQVALFAGFPTNTASKQFAGCRHFYVKLFAAQSASVRISVLRFS